MTIIRVVHQKNYTVINNSILGDDRLSWKAKGIWLYAFSRPDDWKFHVEDIINQSTDSADSTYSGLNELEKFGYLDRNRPRNKNGRFANSDWIFYEVSQSNLKKSLPHRDFPYVENPALPSTEAKLNTKTTTLPPPNPKNQQTVVGGGFFPLKYEKKPTIIRDDMNATSDNICSIKSLDLLQISNKDKQRLLRLY